MARRSGTDTASRTAVVVDRTDYTQTAFEGSLYAEAVRVFKGKRTARRYMKRQEVSSKKPLSTETSSICISPSCVNRTKPLELLCSACQKKANRGDSDFDVFHEQARTTDLSEWLAGLTKTNIRPPVVVHAAEVVTPSPKIPQATSSYDVPRIFANGTCAQGQQLTRCRACSYFSAVSQRCDDNRYRLHCPYFSRASVGSAVGRTL
jgi:hypothetical protein